MAGHRSDASTRSIDKFQNRHNWQRPRRNAHNFGQRGRSRYTGDDTPGVALARGLTEGTTDAEKAAFRQQVSAIRTEEEDKAAWGVRLDHDRGLTWAGTSRLQVTGDTPTISWRSSATTVGDTPTISWCSSATTVGDAQAVSWRNSATPLGEAQAISWRNSARTAGDGQSSTR